MTRIANGDTNKTAVPSTLLSHAESQPGPIEKKKEELEPADRDRSETGLGDRETVSEPLEPRTGWVRRDPADRNRRSSTSVSTIQRAAFLENDQPLMVFPNGSNRDTLLFRRLPIETDPQRAAQGSRRDRRDPLVVRGSKTAARES